MGVSSEEGSSQVDLKQSCETSARNLREKIDKLPTVKEGTQVLSPSIWRVRPHLRNLDAEAYKPKLVSIGPVHHGISELFPMERVKLQNLESETLDIYLMKVFPCLNKAREEYSEKVDQTDAEFAELLVVDGCFIVNYLIWISFPDISDTSFLLKVRWGSAHMRRDLLLLENQIPFFVLNTLFQETVIRYPSLKEKDLNLVSLALKFLEINIRPEKHPDPSEVLHLLHLQHLCQDPCLVDDRPRRQWQLLGPTTAACATELIEAGVKFKRKETPEEYETACQLQISFGDGTLEIPPLLVAASTCTELRNLIAFEQCRPSASYHFSSYCIFMDHIINTPDDVAILRRSGVLENHLGSDAEVAEFVNGLCKEIYIGRETLYAEICAELRAFCQVARHRWRANLVQKYLSNPWKIISIIAGTLLLLFTGLQTFWRRN